MGNSLATLCYYLGLQDVESYNQVVAGVELIKEEELLERLDRLEANMDLNKDNWVTKEELDTYFSQLSNKIDSNNDGIVSKEELKAYVQRELETNQLEVEKWQRAYNTLWEDHQRLKDSLIREEGRVLEVSNISTSVLKDYVNREIIQTDTNLKLIPDVLERKAYVKLYKTLLKSIEKLSHKTAFELLGHRISFAIQPIYENKEE